MTISWHTIYLFVLYLTGLIALATLNKIVFTYKQLLYLYVYTCIIQFLNGLVTRSQRHEIYGNDHFSFPRNPPWGPFFCPPPCRPPCPPSFRTMSPSISATISTSMSATMSARAMSSWRFVRPQRRWQNGIPKVWRTTDGRTYRSRCKRHACLKIHRIWWAHPSLHPIIQIFSLPQHFPNFLK